MKASPSTYNPLLVLQGSPVSPILRDLHPSSGGDNYKGGGERPTPAHNCSPSNLHLPHVTDWWKTSKISKSSRNFLWPIRHEVKSEEDPHHSVWSLTWHNKQDYAFHYSHCEDHCIETVHDYTCERIHILSQQSWHSPDSTCISGSRHEELVEDGIQL